MEEISNKTKLLLIGISLIPIAIVIFFAGLIIVNAQNTISSIQLNYNNTSTSEWQAMYNSSNNNWANFGRGKLIFTTLVYKDSPNTTFDVPGVVGIYAYSGNNLTTCETGSININEDGDDYIKGYMLNVVCDMNMGERGITQIVAQFETNSQNSWTTKTSFYMTFVSDLTLNNTQIIQEQEAYTRDVINNATNLINQTNSNLVTNILNAINTNHNAMYNLLLSKLDSQTNAINNQTTTINNNHDEMMNEDVDATTKQNVDQTEYNNYKDKEDDLMDVASQADLTGLEIGIDRGTSSTIWQLITRIIQSNTKVFSLFISILSIGIIKIALAR